jgi:hypothetical protein
MKWLRWDGGRQLSGYSKMLIAASKLLKFDCYIIKIPDGAAIPEHIDPSPAGYEHHRLNIALKKPCIGTGKMVVNGPAKIFLWGRAILFRPDLYKHHLEPVEFIFSNESMYLLSIGWLKKTPHHNVDVLMGAIKRAAEEEKNA